jgi:hypothetical protein
MNGARFIFFTLFTQLLLLRRVGSIRVVACARETIRVGVSNFAHNADQ